MSCHLGYYGGDYGGASAWWSLDKSGPTCALVSQSALMSDLENILFSRRSAGAALTALLEGNELVSGVLAFVSSIYCPSAELGIKWEIAA